MKGTQYDIAFFSSVGQGSSLYGDFFTEVFLNSEDTGQGPLSQEPATAPQDSVSKLAEMEVCILTKVRKGVLGKQNYREKNDNIACFLL